MELLTGQDTATARAVSDTASRVNAVCSRRQTVITNAVLAINQLAQGAGGTSGGRQMETAAISAADEGVRAGRKSREGEEALHSGKRVRGESSTNE